MLAIVAVGFAYAMPRAIVGITRASREVSSPNQHLHPATPASQPTTVIATPLPENRDVAGPEPSHRTSPHAPRRLVVPTRPSVTHHRRHKGQSTSDEAQPTPSDKHGHRHGPPHGSDDPSGHGEKTGDSSDGQSESGDDNGGPKDHPTDHGDGNDHGHPHSDAGSDDSPLSHGIEDGNGSEEQHSGGDDSGD